MKVKVEAKAFPDRIELTQNFEAPYLSADPIVNMHREVLRLKDAAVRDALISLGWTPPTESKRFAQKSDKGRLKPTSELKPEQFFIGSKIIAFNGYFFECEWDGEHWCSIGGDDFEWWMSYPEVSDITRSVNEQ